VLKLKRTQGDHKVYNLGNHKSEALLRFIELMEKEFNCVCNKTLLPLQDGDVKETYADIKESIRDFEFDPKTSIDEGIPLFVDWYKHYNRNKVSG
jgi:UDP-glucuronate 4-epimerase